MKFTRIPGPPRRTSRKLQSVLRGGLGRLQPYRSTGALVPCLWDLGASRPPGVVVPMTRVLFVDDHPLYRSGVQRALEEAMPDLVVAVATDHDSALAYLADHDDVDLCLSD